MALNNRDSRWLATYQAGYEGAVVNYVLGEVCILAQVDAGAEAGTVYASTRDAMNRWIAANLPRAQTTYCDSFARDFAPMTLRERFLNAPEPLRELQRVRDPELRQVELAPRAPRQDQPRHLEELPSSADEPDRMAPESPKRVLCFYQLGEQLSVDQLHDLAEMRTQRTLIRELVNWLNAQLVCQKPPLETASTFPTGILAATPNWLVFGTQGGCPGPAGVPAPLTGPLPEPGESLLTFGDEGLNEVVATMARRSRELSQAAAPTEAPRPDVVVAVLDTSPTRTFLDDVANNPLNPPYSWLFGQVYDKVKDSVDNPPGLPSDYFTPFANYLPNWQGPERDPTIPRDSFSMADHGLFIAGIVQQLAPRVGLQLIRVIGDYGSCDLLAVASVAARLTNDILKNTTQRLVLNLSLGADVPINTEEGVDFSDGRVKRWLPNTFDDLAAQRKYQAEINDLLDRAHFSLRHLMEWLSNDRVLVVAATGNDDFVPPVGPKRPRYPAAYSSTLGVSATQKSQELAAYSNWGDEKTNLAPRNPPNGVATYGGNAQLPSGPGSGPAVIDTTAVPVDAIKGIFTAPTLPITGVPNTTGWVYWAGTSFATPIISAIAANHWAEHDKKTAGQVKAWILGKGVSPGVELLPGLPDVPCIVAEPT